MISRKLLAVIHFSRPHTIIATSLQVTGLFILSASMGPWEPESLLLLLVAFAACLSANIYIVGLNQLTDVDLDRINKPDLPLASGALTISQGQWLVLLLGLAALILAISQGPFLLATVTLSMLIGTAYSAQPLHLKSRPFWAALSIAFVRGLLTNVGLFLHFHTSLQPTAPVPWELLSGISVFFFGFGLVIALYKDIPDLIGDRQFGIRTFTVRLGPQMVFGGGRIILTIFFLIPLAASLLLLPAVSGFALLMSQLAFLLYFWLRSRSVDLSNPAAVTRFYMLLWSLFYAEYILLSLYAITGGGI